MSESTAPPTEPFVSTGMNWLKLERGPGLHDFIIDGVRGAEPGAIYASMRTWARLDPMSMSQAPTAPFREVVPYAFR